MGGCLSSKYKESKKKKIKKVFFNKEICDIYISLDINVRKKVFLGLMNRKFLNSHFLYISRIIDCKSSLLLRNDNYQIPNNIQFSEVLYKTNLTKLCVLKLQLKGRYLGNQGISLLSMALEKLKNLSVLILDLSENDINDKGCDILGNTIKKLEKLEIVFIRINNNRITNQACWRLRHIISGLLLIKKYKVIHENNSVSAISSKHNVPIEMINYRSILSNDIQFSTVDLL